MPTALQEKLSALLPELLNRLTLENVRRIAMEIKGKNGLHMGELDGILRCSNDQDAVTTLYRIVDAGSDRCILIFADALRVVLKDDLAEKLAPAVAASAASTRNTGNLSDRFQKASAKIKERLTEGEVGKIVSRLHSSNDIDIGDYEQIQTTNGAIAKATLLLDNIGKKEDRVIEDFLSMLRGELNRKDLADLVN